MFSFAGPGGFRFAVGAAFALLTCVLLAPATARADCGDYVVFGAKGHQPSGALPAMMPHAYPASPHGPLPKHAPCSGSRCSQGRLPLAPPPSTAPVAGERWAFALTFPVLVEAGESLLGSDANSPRPLDQPSTVYHPPR